MEEKCSVFSSRHHHQPIMQAFAKRVQVSSVLKSCKTLPKSLAITWDDNFKAEFPYCWLRDTAGTTRPALVHIDLNTRPEHVVVDANKSLLHVTWPCFVNLSYSSSFLRENVSRLGTELRTGNNYAKSDSDGSAANFEPQRANSILNGKLWHETSQSPIAPSLVMGQCEWANGAREPGTLWAHLETVPSLCVVDVMEETVDPAELTLIDAEYALRIMATEHPEEFQFFQRCKIQYSEGPFRAFHPIYELSSDEKSLKQVTFNNTLRSPLLSTPSLETLYRSLQIFGRVCARASQPFHLFPGRRLLIDNTRAMLGSPAQNGRRLRLSLIH